MQLCNPQRGLGAEYSEGEAEIVRVLIHGHRPAGSMAARDRPWSLTLNNPTDEEIARLLASRWDQVPLARLALEVGKEGTPHIQGFIRFKNGKTMSAVKKWAGTDRLHLEVCRSQDYTNWMYVGKGSQTKDEWDEHGVDGDHYGDDVDIIYEKGEEPAPSGATDPWSDIMLMVQRGESTLSIIAKYPGIAIRCQTAIEKYRLEWDRQTAEWRDVEVVYLTGPTGTGKTRQVMEKYGYANVYRATDKKHPFETYNGQDVLVFEEFRSSYRIEDMLNWLDGYPVELPARYANKLAQFTKVYIISNWDWHQQYQSVQECHPTTWKALCRRIGEIRAWDEVREEFFSMPV